MKRFNAFISYKHQKSTLFATSLEKALQQYARPLLSRPLAIFRDERFLVPGASLPNSISAALERSDHMILLASPESAKSAWVDSELRQWCSQPDRVSNLIIVLVDGDIAESTDRTSINWSGTTALPPSLMQLSGLPLYLDLRWVDVDTEQLTLQNARFKLAINSIVAKLRGVEPDTMINEEVRTWRRNRRLRAVALGLLITSTIAAGAGAIWGFLGQRAARRGEQAARDQEELARQEAQRARDQARIAVAREWLDKDPTTAGLILSDVERPELAALWQAVATEVVRQPRTAVLLGAGSAGIVDARFGPAGDCILAGSADTLARLWKLDGSKPVLLKGHSVGNFGAAAVGAVGFSPDGRKMVTGGDDGIVRVWDLGGKELFSFDSGATGRLRNITSSVAFSRDGKKVVASWWDGSFGLWDSATGKPVAAYQTDGAGIVSAVVDSTASRIAVAAADGDAAIATIEKGVSMLRGSKARLTSIAWSPDDRLVATTSDDGTARVWRTDRSAPPIVLDEHRGRVVDAVFSPDATSLATASEDATARVWQLDGSNRTIVLVGHQAALTDIEYSRDGSQVLTASADGTARVWNANGSGAALVLAGHRSSVVVVDFSPDGSKILTGSKDGDVRVWANVAPVEPIVLTGHRGAYRGERLEHARDPTESSLSFTAEDGKSEGWERFKGNLVPLYEREVRSVRFAPDGRSIVTASEDKTARLWRVDGREPPRVLRGHTDDVLDAAFSADGRFILTRSSDKTARIWNAANEGAPIIHKRDSIIRFALFSPDSQKVAIGADDGRLEVWRIGAAQYDVRFETKEKEFFDDAEFSPDGKLLAVAQGKRVRIWEVSGRGDPISLAHDTLVHQVQWSADGRRLLTRCAGWIGKGDGYVLVWENGKWRDPKRLGEHADAVFAAAFSPDGRYVATASRDRTAKIWNAGDAKEVATLRGHVNAVTGVVFAADSKQVLTWSDDGSARLWSVAAPSTPLVFSGHLGKISEAAISPTNMLVATASDDGTARLWRYSVFELKRLLGAGVGVCLPSAFRAEWLGETIQTANERSASCERAFTQRPFSWLRPAVSQSSDEKPVADAASARKALWLHGTFLCKAIETTRLRSCRFHENGSGGHSLSFEHDVTCGEVLFDAEGNPERLEKCSSRWLNIPPTAKLRSYGNPRTWAGSQSSWFWPEGEPYCCPGLWLVDPSYGKK